MSPDTPSSSLQSSRKQRILSCVLCQQRKVKCERKFPCANCVRFHVQCVPATTVQRPRRRRFPEHDLLDRLRKYEDLLRQNKIEFEPLHKNMDREKESSYAEGHDSDEERLPEAVDPNVSTPSTTVKSERDYEAKYALFKTSIEDD